MKVMIEIHTDRFAPEHQANSKAVAAQVRAVLEQFLRGDETTPPSMFHTAGVIAGDIKPLLDERRNLVGTYGVLDPDDA